LFALSPLPEQEREQIEESFTGELAYMALTRKDSDRSLHYSQQFYEVFLKTWSSMSPFALAARKAALAKLQRVAELEEFVLFTREKPQDLTRTFHRLTSAWEKRFPAQLDDIDVWHDFVPQRVWLLEQMFYHVRQNFEGAERNQALEHLAQSTVPLYLEFARNARKQHNWIVCRTALSKAKKKVETASFEMILGEVKYFRDRGRLNDPSYFSNAYKALQTSSRALTTPLRRRQFHLLSADIASQLALILRERQIDQIDFPVPPQDSLDYYMTLLLSATDSLALAAQNDPDAKVFDKFSAHYDSMLKLESELLDNEQLAKGFVTNVLRSMQVCSFALEFPNFLWILIWFDAAYLFPFIYFASSHQPSSVLVRAANASRLSFQLSKPILKSVSILCSWSKKCPPGCSCVGCLKSLPSYPTQS
jgi:hypothetical protein